MSGIDATGTVVMVKQVNIANSSSSFYFKNHLLKSLKIPLSKKVSNAFLEVYWQYCQPSV